MAIHPTGQSSHKNDDDKKKKKKRDNMSETGGKKPSKKELLDRFGGKKAAPFKNGKEALQGILEGVPVREAAMSVEARGITLDKMAGRVRKVISSMMGEDGEAILRIDLLSLKNPSGISREIKDLANEILNKKVADVVTLVAQDGTKQEHVPRTDDDEDDETDA